MKNTNNALHMTTLSHSTVIFIITSSISMRYHSYAMKEAQPSYACRAIHRSVLSVLKVTLQHAPSKGTRYGRENKAMPQ